MCERCKESRCVRYRPTPVCVLTGHRVLASVVLTGEWLRWAMIMVGLRLVGAFPTTSCVTDSPMQGATSMCGWAQGEGRGWSVLLS